MMHDEWNALTKKPCTPEQFAAVNEVYMWHPATPEGTEGARAYCLKLWRQFGYGIFFDMTPIACDFEALQCRMTAIKANKNHVKDEYNTAMVALNADCNAKLDELNNDLSAATKVMNQMKARYAHA